MKTLALFRNTGFRVPEWYEHEARGVLEGRYAGRLTDVDRPVRRVLDIGAGAGEFAVWAFRRWPGCWVDMVEYSELAPLAEENGPPGSKLLPGGRLRVDLYDVVRLRHLFPEVIPLLSEIPIVILDVISTSKETVSE